MHYLVSVIHDGSGLGTPDEHAAIDGPNERLQADGHWCLPAACSATAPRSGR